MYFYIKFPFNRLISTALVHESKLNHVSNKFDYDSFVHFTPSTIIDSDLYSDQDHKSLYATGKVPDYIVNCYTDEKVIPDSNPNLYIMLQVEKHLEKQKKFLENCKHLRSRYIREKFEHLLENFPFECSFDERNNLIIYFGDILVTSSAGDQHMIRGVYIRLGVSEQSMESITFSPNPSLIRDTYSKEEFSADYKFSHCNMLGRPDKFDLLCLGENRSFDAIRLSTDNNDYLNFEQQVFSIYNILHYEYTPGVYISIARIPLQHLSANGNSQLTPENVSKCIKYLAECNVEVKANTYYDFNVYEVKNHDELKECLLEKFPEHALYCTETGYVTEKELENIPEEDEVLSQEGSFTFKDKEIPILVKRLSENVKRKPVFNPLLYNKINELIFKELNDHENILEYNAKQNKQFSKQHCEEISRISSEITAPSHYLPKNTVSNSISA